MGRRKSELKQSYHPPFLVVLVAGAADLLQTSGDPWISDPEHWEGID